jgi:ABC-2 type transport system permease protein
VVVALVVACAAVVAVFATGLLTGAKIDSTGRWAATFAIAWLVSTLFALYGLAVAQMFRSESAIGIGSASLVLFGFFGNLFVPLSGAILQVARWTPMYGYAGLVRYPLLGGRMLDTGQGAVHTDPLWALVVNAAAWAVVFAAISLWAVRRGRRRQ